MRLTDYLAREGLNASKFATRLGVPSSTVTRILTGARRPSWGVMQKISVATDGEVSNPADFALCNPSVASSDAARQEGDGA